jgi:hypothetical protein
MTRDPRSSRVPRQWIVGALLRIYPAAWRSEYGDELTGVLLARPLGPRVIADLLWNGLRQRVPTAAPSTIFGSAWMFIILIGLVEGGGRAMLQPTSMTFPPVAVTFMSSYYFIYLLIFCGCWTHLRNGGRARRSGLAGMRMGFIAGIPIMVTALLMMSGVLELSFAGARLPRPSTWAILIAPIARLPECWIWGAFGGMLGQRIARNRQRAGAIPASSL